MRKPLLYLETLGCPKNQADSRQIRGMMQEKGYTFTTAPQEAEIILVNTCGFIDEAKEESIRTILLLSGWKRKGACSLLIVMGCLPQKYGPELEKSLPEVDLFFGVADWQSLADYIEEEKEKKQWISPPAPAPYRLSWASHDNEESYGYIKIAEGCDHHCTFCVIPQIRGRFHSRRPEDIVAEVAVRAAKGLREAVLVAQDTGAYGRDLAPVSSLAELVGMLCAVDGLERIRILYCYPEEVNDQLMQAMKHPKVCPYLDMPIQHVDDGVLRRMGRTMSGAKIKETIRRLRETVPGLVIRSTLMVGFPGETEEAFQSLMDFLEEYHLERVGFFSFSPQPDTPAYRMPDQVPEAEKERRLEIIQNKQNGIMARWNDSLIGRILPVLIDAEAGEDPRGRFYEGRSVWDAPEIDGMVGFYSDKEFEPGHIAWVRITHSAEYILSGEIADEFGQ